MIQCFEKTEVIFTSNVKHGGHLVLPGLCCLGLGRAPCRRHQLQRRGCHTRWQRCRRRNLHRKEFLSTICNFFMCSRWKVLKGASLTSRFSTSGFFFNQFPPGPLSILLGPFSNFNENPRSYSKVKCNHQYQREHH